MRVPLVVGILAGGRALRMGGRDKAWVERDGRALVLGVRDSLPRDAEILVNANRGLERYASHGLKVVADRWPDHPGPMAGIATLLHAVDSDWLLTTPVDVARLPRDYVDRMLAARTPDPLGIVVAQDEEGLQPLFALYPTRLSSHALESFEAGRRSVRDWQHRFALYPCPFAGERFGNMNSEADLESA